MDNKWILNFSVHGQIIQRTTGIYHFASNLVGCVDAVFSLNQDWKDLDQVSAVWRTRSYRNGIATVLDSDGRCEVPQELLRRQDILYVNLVGSVASGDVLTTRLTSYNIAALEIDSDAMTSGSETAPVTPSQFEQYVAIVKDDADRAEASAENAAAEADRAEQAAANAGYMFFHIDENGHLIYERTDNTQVDFYLEDGHLYVEALA